MKDKYRLVEGGPDLIEFIYLQVKKEELLMKLLNCRSCGKIFYYAVGPELCPHCVSVFEERFQMVKEYIYDHPHAGAHEVAKEFDISVQTIYRWVKEERLEFSQESAVGIPCECCGRQIKSGRFCEACKLKLAHGLEHAYGDNDQSGAVQQQSRSGNARMRIQHY